MALSRGLYLEGIVGMLAVLLVFGAAVALMEPGPAAAAVITGAALLVPIIVAMAYQDPPRSAPAAEYVTIANVACSTEQAFDQWVAAKARGDSRATQHLASTAACFSLKAGLPVSHPAIARAEGAENPAVRFRVPPKSLFHH